MDNQTMKFIYVLQITSLHNILNFHGLYPMKKRLKTKTACQLTSLQAEAKE
ncbi:hypothetical protein BAOM_3542 [Peribacillus asahii]|uniref:Uncharacterized protein n=1 Tax=Peribacillus asahii TaxID=228899 RepID=A0A3Q9RQ46_9BACI|nr:hypothetical protein BAOM_3542 [Peribacillus asahii]